MSGKKFIFWGASGQAIVLEELLRRQGDELICLFDNNENVHSPFEDLPLFYGKGGFETWLDGQQDIEISFAVAVGGEHGQQRNQIHDYLEQAGLKSSRLIHSRAFVADNAVIGDGCQILAHATIGARVHVEKSVIVNSAAVVEHECVLNEGVHIGPGAVLGGLVHVRENSFVGLGARVLPRIQIGKNAVIGAGAVVTKDVADNAVVVGIPARPIPNPNA